MGWISTPGGQGCAREMDMLSYDDPRRTGFLDAIPVEFRGDVGNLFLRQIRLGEEDRALIARLVWIAVGERESGGALGPGSIPAATLRAAMAGNREAVFAFIEFQTEWDRLSPSEKEAAKAHVKASYRNRWYRRSAA